MIVGADKRVSRAFVATLRDEPSSVDLSAAFTRKERRDAILTVSGLAYAIARAEEHMRERVRTSRASQPDIFDTLSATTDDCMGPAFYQPYIPTPVPPAPVSASVEDTLVMPLLPSMRVPVMAAPVSAPAPILVLDRQAFYHPAGRIPGFAYGEPTRSRRSALGWAAIAFAPLLALMALTTVLVLARLWQPHVTATLPAAAPAKLEAPAPVVSATPKPAPIPEEPAILVVDVKTLKPLPAKTRPRH